MSISARRLQRKESESSLASALTFTFDSGTSGANVSSSVTAPGDTPWGGVGIGAGSTLTNDTTHIAHGTMAAKLVPASGSAVTMRWDVSASLRGAYCFYTWWDASPTADTFCAWLGADTTTKVTAIAITPTGIIRAYGTPVGSAYSTPAGILRLGGWTRIELAYQVDPANSANGKIRLGVYAGDSTTALADSGWVTTDLGLLGAAVVRFGKFGGDANTSGYWLDSIAYHQNAVDLLGPVGGMANTSPIANAGGDQSVSTGTTVTLDGSGSSDSDGTIASYSWTQTGGTTVTLSSTTVQKPTFTAPASASTLTFSLIVTDNNGSSSSADSVTVAVTSGALAYEWSDSNLPWAYTNTAQFTAKWPSSGVTYVNYTPGGGDFYTELYALVNAQSGRVVVRLPAGTFHLNQFRMIGTSGDPNYAKGFWHPKLRGLLGQGPDKTIVQMDPNSMTTEQLNRLSTMPKMTEVNHMSMWRFDGSTAAERVLIAGLTFRGTDQNTLNSVHPDIANDWGVVMPQPAPYAGINLYSGVYAYLSYVRFQASAHAVTSAPPFEAGCVSSQYGNVEFDHCEMDGRLAPEVDAARPKRCTVIMGNNETVHKLIDCWLHDSNVSRYAVNDENRETFGLYELTRTKIERITTNKNYNKGGYTNAAVCGWESCAATINITDCIFSVDNPYVEPSAGSSQHLQFTSVGARNPSTPGHLTVRNTQFRNTGFPNIHGYTTIRCISNIAWYTSGLNNTMEIYHTSGTRLQPYVYTGTWPPSTATLNAAGVSPSTHYLVRTG